MKYFFIVDVYPFISKTKSKKQKQIGCQYAFCVQLKRKNLFICPFAATEGLSSLFLKSVSHYYIAMISK